MLCIRYLVFKYWLPAFRAWIDYSGRVVIFSSGDVYFSRSQEYIDKYLRSAKVANNKKQSVAVLGWVNISLTEDDKSAILADDLSLETMLQDIGVLVYSGYRFSMSHDDYSGALQASLVCTNPEDGNFQYGISARNPDPFIAVKTLWYKHNMTLDTGYRAYITRAERPDWS